MILSLMIECNWLIFPERVEALTSQTKMSIEFWGVRGSYPQAGKDFVRVGGHTSCVSLVCEDHIIIFDAGTGLINLGGKMLNKSFQSINFLLSHFHLDHVFGIPFFLPIWNSQSRLNFYSGIAEPFGGTHAALKNLFSPPYFPVPWEKFPSQRQCYDFIIGQPITVGNIQIQTINLDHPGGGSGYRIDHKGVVIVYLSDTSHAPSVYNDYVHFAKDADLLIYDATFTCEEFEKHPDWGHSTWKKGVELAKAAKVKKLALYHHDPAHTDHQMDEIEQQAQKLFSGSFVAKEEMKLDF